MQKVVQIYLKCCLKERISSEVSLERAQWWCSLLSLSKAGGGVHLVASSRCSWFPALPAALRSGLLHVRLARPREGHPHRHPAPQVSAAVVTRCFTRCFTRLLDEVWNGFLRFLSSSCSILAVESREDAGIFLVLTTTGHYSLFPLIFTPAGKHQTQTDRGSIWGSWTSVSLFYWFLFWNISWLFKVTASTDTSTPKNRSRFGEFLLAVFVTSF